MTKKHPSLMVVSPGQYRIIKSRHVPPEEQAKVLNSVTRSRVDERLAALITTGRVAVSTVASKYHDLLSKVSGGC